MAVRSLRQQDDVDEGAGGGSGEGGLEESVPLRFNDHHSDVFTETAACSMKGQEEAASGDRWWGEERTFERRAIRHRLKERG
jgi:hypothetical protein